MRHILFDKADNLSIAVLVKNSLFRKDAIKQAYINPLNKEGINSEDIIAFDLLYNEAGKAPNKFIKDYLELLLPELAQLGIKYLLVPDINYFKVLTKKTKADPYYGYALPCAIKGYEHFQVILSVNYQAIIYNPGLQEKLTLSLKTLVNLVNGVYTEPGSSIIHYAEYPSLLEDIKNLLRRLLLYPVLSCDIEAFSLRVQEAGIGSIAFAWDEHNGAAFLCDWGLPTKSIDEQGNTKKPSFYGRYSVNTCVRDWLREFFEVYEGKLIWHNASYDLKVLIYTLWMEHPLDMQGMLKGLHIMTRHFEDTKLIAYLATNSTAGNQLGLKALAHNFAGNWAVDSINDIRTLKAEELLQYNLIDALSTWYVFNRYYPVMVQDQQEILYKGLFLPSLKTIIQIELCGMPMKESAILKAKADLEATQKAHLDQLYACPIVQAFNTQVQTKAMQVANSKLKTKQHPLSKFAHLVYNPNSNPQTQTLLYEELGLPIVDYTSTKQPSTSGDTLEKLLNFTQDSQAITILKSLIGYTKVNKILSTFIPAFEKGWDKPDGAKYLHGSFNLGGTVSGRLSSSDPNLQNLPSGSEYGKQIKSCFSAPEGWLFVGADFASLEDRINALLTQDPAKLQVYTDGYDGHSLRAYAYFKDQMPDIEDTVESINSIPDKYPQLRQDSKAPTFALTYQGTWMTMVKNLGWSEEKSKAVEANYHKLYEVSTNWVKSRIQEATLKGFSEAAFGLRIRTPLLAQSILGNRSTLREAEAEARTLGNAISGQSYGLLTNRALNAFMERVWNSPYKYDVKPVAMIHDAIYLVIRDDINVVHWVNKELIQEMSWQELPEIQHPEVKLGAELDIYWPDWANPITLSNNATKEEIISLCKEQRNNT